MSILINGMEMPKDGEKLYMIAFSDGKACASYKPFEWHEVVPVPAPHGRLGDLDALAEYVHQQDDWLSETAIHAFCGILCKTPTIIPAEETHTMEEFMYGQEGNPNDGSM